MAKTETIDMGMNWRAAAGMIAITLENSATQAGRTAARGELDNMAKAADLWNENARNMQTLVRAGRELLNDGGPVNLETLRAALANFSSWEC